MGNIDIKLTTCLGLTFAISAAVTMLTTPVWRNFYLRRGWIDEPGPRKIHATATALAGGAAVMSGFVAAAIVVAFLTALKQFPESTATDVTAVKLAGIMIGTVAIFLLGVCDDVRELRPRTKLFGQIVVAVGTVALGVRIPLIAQWPIAQWAVSVWIIVLVINAMNFLDNMNGLCAGLGAVASATLAGWSLMTGRPILAATCLAVTGASGAFVPFNYPRGSVFLGDGGSHLIGYLAIVLALLAGEPASDSHRSIRVLLPLLTLFVPVYDIFQVVLFRIWRRRPVYIGDTNHVSHQLVRAGLSPATAVLILWAVGAAIGALGLVAAAK